MLTVMLCQIYF